MTDEQLERLMDDLSLKFKALFISLDRIRDELTQTQQMIKACAIAQIELPNGYDATATLEQINNNFEGVL